MIINIVTTRQNAEKNQRKMQDMTKKYAFNKKGLDSLRTKFVVFFCFRSILIED